METKAFKEELSGYLGHLIADAEKFARSDFFAVCRQNLECYCAVSLEVAIAHEK